MAEGHGTGSQLLKLQPTDSTTIGLGNAIVYRGAREPNGQLAPIEGGDAVGNRDSGNNQGRGNVMSPTTPAAGSASGSGRQVHGYASSFRVTPVPQPKQCSAVAPVPQTGLRLSLHSSQPQPTRDIRDAPPQPPFKNAPIAPSSACTSPSTPASPRTGAPASSSRQAHSSKSAPDVPS